jgi:hypothetical protein
MPTYGYNVCTNIRHKCRWFAAYTVTIAGISMCIKLVLNYTSLYVVLEVTLLVAELV